MGDRKFFTAGKLTAAVFVLSAAWLFLGGIAPAQAAVHTCVWTAASSTAPTLINNAENWWRDGGTCALDSDSNLLFDTTASTTATSSAAVWNAALIVKSITVSTTYAGTITMGAAIATTTGDFTIKGGTVNLTGGTSAINVQGSLVTTAGTINSGASNIYLWGTTKTLGGAAAATLANVYVSGSGSYTLAGNVTASGTVIVNTGGTLNGGDGFSLTLNGSGVPFYNGGTFSAQTSTVTYSGSAATTIASTTYYNLTVNTTGSFDGAATTTNTLTVNAGKSLALGTQNLVAGGNISNSGTITQTSGTVTMTGASATLGSATGNTTFYDLTINGTLVTLGGSVTTTDFLTVNAGKTLAGATYTINVTRATGTPFVLTGTGAFTSNTSTVNYAGVTSSTIATSTYYNLTVNTTSTLGGPVTSTNVLTINTGSLDAATYTVILSGSGTPFVITGTFTPSTSTISYTSAGSVTTAAGSYYKTTLGSGTYTLGGNTTSTNSFVNGGTLTIGSSYYLYAPVTFDNNGTITESGAIRHPLASAVISDSAGTEDNGFDTSADSAYIAVTDTDGNLNASAVDTITGTVVTASGYSDSETITLTESAADTGLFISAALPFVVTGPAATNNSGKFEVSGNGTLTLAFTDSKESTDTGSDTASFTGPTYSGGGSSGGGGGTTVVIPTVSNSGDAIKINAGASETGSQTVTLSFSGISNATQMAVSNDAAFTGVAYETFVSTKIWTMTSGDGLKTVYVRFRSSSGGGTATYSDTITLRTGATDTTPVTTPATTPVEQTTSGTTGGTTATVTFTKTLTVGSSGTEVKALQQTLKDLGLFTYPTITSYFGSITKAAVIAYQKANSLSATGIVDSATRAVLNGGSAPAPVAPVVTVKGKFTLFLTVGSAGTEVKLLQQTLKDLGYFTYPTITGNFGSITKAAVVAFQKAKNLAPYPGYVGPGTRAALNAVLAE